MINDEIIYENMQQG